MKAISQSFKLYLFVALVATGSALLALGLESFLGSFILIRGLAVLSSIVFLLGSMFVSLFRFEWGLAMFFAILPVFVRLEAGFPFTIGFVTITPETLFIVVFLFIWFLKAARENKPFLTKTNLDLPIFLLVLSGFISLTNSVEPVESIQAFIAGFIQPIALYYIIVNNIKSVKQLKPILYAILIGFLIASSYSLYLFLNQGYDIRMGYTFGNPNRHAFYVVVMLPYLIALLSLPKKKYKGIINIFLSVIILLVILSQIMTASRGGILIMGFIIMAFFYNRHYRLLVMKFVPIFIVLIAIGFSLKGELLQSKFGFFAKRFAVEGLYNASRLDIWEGSIAMIRDHPLVGIGLNMFRKIFPRYMIPNPRYLLPEGLTLSAHNSFLQAWIELGLLGILAFVGILTFSLRDAMRAYRYSNNASLKVLSFASLIALVSVIIDSIASPLPVYVGPSFILTCPIMFWSLLGFIQVLRRMK